MEVDDDMRFVAPDTAGKVSATRLAAVIENRAREVGLAVFDPQKMQLTLCQLIETSRSYTNTVSLLEHYDPQQLLVVAQQQGGVNGATANSFPQLPTERKAFNDTAAFRQLAAHAVGCSQTLAVRLGQGASRYLSLAAAGALLSHLEQQKLTLRTRALRVDWKGSTGHMQVPSAAVDALEILKPMLRPAAACSAASRGLSLFTLLDKTVTKPGRALLKASLVEPLMHLPSIAARHEAIQFLLDHRSITTATRKVLQEMPQDPDQMWPCLGLLPNRQVGTPAARIAQSLDAALLLRATLQALPRLAAALHGASDGNATENRPCGAPVPLLPSLLEALAQLLAQGSFRELLAFLESAVDPDAQPARSGLLAKLGLCMALRKGYDQMLDVARDAFNKVTQDTTALVASYQDRFPHSGIRAKYTSKKGFHLLAPAPGNSSGRGRPAEPLPDTEFVARERPARGLWHYTTDRLLALNTRLRACMSDCFSLAEALLDALLSQVSQHMELLRRLVDGIALLDLLCSAASFVASSSHVYTRPQVTERGPIILLQARHPLLERLLEPGQQFYPNDTVLSSSSSLNIILSPNMSGKSTYLKQVALNVILAQAGLFVAAEYATIGIVDLVFACMSKCDGADAALSSFMAEMKDAAHAIQNATDRSLLLVDELGSSTSSVDGAGIAWAIAEYCISLGCRTLFASHFEELQALAEHHPACKLWHLQVDTAGGTGTRPGMRFRWQLKQGQHQVKHYGLQLADKVGTPPEVLQHAWKIAAALDAQEAVQQHVVSHDDEQEEERQRFEAAYRLGNKLQGLTARWLFTLRSQQDPGQRSGSPDQDAMTKAAPALMPYLEQLQAEAQSILPPTE